MGILKETNFLDRAALGLIDGVTRLQLHGYNGAITTTHETVWPASSAYTFLLVNMSAPYVSSADANDTAAGTGARTVYVEGVDTNFNAQTETVSLNGQTSVVLTKSYMSINKMTVLTTGSGLKNAGIVYLGTGTNTAGVPAVIHELIPAGLNASCSLRYTVPAGMTFAICHGKATGGTEVQMEIAVNKGPIDASCRYGLPSALFPLFCDYRTPLVMPEKTQFQMKMLASSGTGPACATIDALLYDKTKGALNL